MAKKAQGIVVYMETAIAAGKAISNITQASPAVVSSTAHGYSNGDFVKITGVDGMAQVNNRAYVVDGATDSPLTPNSFELKGIDSSLYTAFASSSPLGSAKAVTLSTIGEVTGIPSLGGTEPNPIDDSHLLSVVATSQSGLPRQSQISFNVWFDMATARHTTLLAANEDQLDRVFRFYKPGSWNMLVVAQVAGVAVSAPDVNSLITASITLLPRGPASWATV